MELVATRAAGVICEMVRGYSKSKKAFAAWLSKRIEPGPFFRHRCYQWFAAEQELLDYLGQKNCLGELT